jgi:hypothetical protein
MKKFVFAVALSLVFSAQGAFAGFTFDPDGPGGDAAMTNVNTFDWLPGNALSIGSTPAITAGGGIANPFQTVYQARLGSVLDLNSNVLSFPGLNSAYEYTIVASFPEFVSAVVGPIALFDLAPGASFAAYDPLGRVGLIPNYVEIYASPVNANDLAGTGFNDGILALSGVVMSGASDFRVFDVDGDGSTTELFDQFGADNFGGYTTLEGTGSTNITATVGFVNTTFFPGFLPGVDIDLQFFNTSQVNPFQQQNPSNAFTLASGGPAVSIGATLANRTTGAVNGVGAAGGTDFQFQADGNTTIRIGVVPEPSSMMIWVVACACGLRRRRA